jgi:hypothetical protein
MSKNQILSWVDGPGWLVLSGGPVSLGTVRAAALTRIAVEGSVAYIGLNEHDNEDLIEDMGELGAPTGYLVNVMAEDDETVRKQLIDAALIVVPGNFDPATLRGGLLGAAMDGIEAAFKRGSVILIEGNATMLFGKVVQTDSGKLLEGLNWVRNALIVPAITSISESPQARDLLASKQAGIAIGIGVGSALVLGPDAGLELWGQQQVTIALGAASPDSDANNTD